ncbi:MAG: polysaccharide deacetylase family protein, partial [Burkholderiales bacterium]|nr:polysaccharide deacetylase family protein [Burkholderiales bacterium]
MRPSLAPVAATAPPATRWQPSPFITASVGLHAAALGAAVLLPDAAAWSLGAIVANQAAITAAGLWPRSTL